MNKNLLFIGGWTRNQKSYKKLWQTMPKYYDVLFLPCYEVTDKTPIEKSANYIREYLTAHNIKKCIVAGHSLGGGLAIEFASVYPEMVERLILIDNSGINSHHNFKDKVKNITKTQFIYFHSKFKENITTFLRIFSKPIKNYKSLILAYSYDIRHKMKEVACDTLILWGELDHIFPVSQAKEIHELISKSKLEILSTMDHDWIIHSPELFWENLKK